MGISIFITLIIAASVSLLLLIASKIVCVVSKRNQLIELLSSLSRILNSFFVVTISLALLVFSMGSILPYTLNQIDSSNMLFQESNINTYSQEIDKYSNAARKQIEEYQKLQAEMARTASSTQLQFWSQQQDEVGNSLTDKIQDFEKMILESKIEKNLRKAKIAQRSSNKWYFWHK